VNIFLLQRSIAVEIDRATLSENIPGENVRCLSAPQP
jgi:hypothetical protein